MNQGEGSRNPHGSCRKHGHDDEEELLPFKKRARFLYPNDIHESSPLKKFRVIIEVFQTRVQSSSDQKEAAQKKKSYQIVKRSSAATSNKDLVAACLSLMDTSYTEGSGSGITRPNIGNGEQLNRADENTDGNHGKNVQEAEAFEARIGGNGNNNNAIADHTELLDIYIPYEEESEMTRVQQPVSRAINNVPAGGQQSGGESLRQRPNRVGLHLFGNDL